MNNTLMALAEMMQAAFAAHAPKAYQAGRLKIRQKYGVIKPWGQKDNVNISVLLNRHAEELAKAMAKAEARLVKGESIEEVVAGFLSRVDSWSWALFPAMTLGMTTSLESNRQEIAAKLPPGKKPNLLGMSSPDSIGIIWHIVDQDACRVCQYLNGRWFDAREAYDLASRVHPNCRCPKEFDVGTPDEATVGPIEDYKPGTISDVYRNLNVSGLAQARMSRVRRANTARGKI